MRWSGCAIGSWIRTAPSGRSTTNIGITTRPGIYVEARTGEALFASTNKYDSGSGWPSFTTPIDPDNIILREDNALGMRRIEVRSRRGNAHLGHVFDDGPRNSGGQRFCINSVRHPLYPARADGGGGLRALSGDRGWHGADGGALAARGGP